MTDEAEQQTLYGHTATTKADRKQLDKQMDMLWWALAAPIITWPGYEDMVTGEQFARIKMERLKKLAIHDFSEEATEFEAMLYTSHFSLTQPLSSAVYNVYRWLFCKHYPEKGKEIFGDEADKQLDEWTENRLLKDLKEWLFKKQKVHLKAREREAKKTAETTEQKPTEPEIIAETLDKF